MPSIYKQIQQFIKQTLVIPVNCLVIFLFFLVIGQSVIGQETLTGHFQQVEADIRITGSINPRIPGGEVVSQKIDVTGKQRYDEWLNSTNTRSIRQYKAISSAIAIDDYRVRPKFRRQSTLIVTDLSATRLLLYSPSGPMTSEELELINLQGNLLVLYQLLPDAELETGFTFDARYMTLAKLLGIDEVSGGKVTGSVSSLEDSIAVLNWTGSITGAADGVATDIDLIIATQFNTSTGRFSSVKIRIKENRKTGLARPGLDVVANINLKILDVPGTPTIGESLISRLDTPPVRGSDRIILRPIASGFTIYHQRNWTLFVDQPQMCVLRMIKNGELVGQCSISRLPNRNPNQPIGAEKFQSGIIGSLGDQFGQVLDRQQYNEGDLRVIRVAVVGQNGDVPVQWNYYHISNPAGQQAVAVFTFELTNEPLITKHDRSMVSTFAFRELSANTPTAQNQQDITVRK